MFLIKDDYLEIKKTQNMGLGIFANSVIQKGIVVGDYIGEILRPEDAVIDENNLYLMYYHDRAVVYPEIDIPGVHLLNNSCIPNCWLYIYKGHTLAFALNNISKGEELTIPYLLPPITKFCNPCRHVCLCRNIDCNGTMHLTSDKYKKWRKINEKQSKETKRERIRYGKELKILNDYPKIIPEEYIKQVKELI